MSSTVSLTIEAPEQVEAPHRWPTKRNGDAPFPHACVPTPTGEIEYQLVRSRQTSLTFKLNHPVQSWGDFRLSLQVKIHETWEDCEDHIFLPLDCWGPYATFLPDNSIKWVIDPKRLDNLKDPPKVPHFALVEAFYSPEVTREVWGHRLCAWWDGGRLQVQNVTSIQTRRHTHPHTTHTIPPSISTYASASSSLSPSP